MRKKMSGFEERSLKESLMFASPWIVGFLIFFLYPIVTSVRLSFSSITSLANFTLTFVGLENYKEILFFNTEYVPTLLSSMLQTIIFVPCIVFLSMVFAVILNNKIKFKGFFRVVFFLPVLLGTGYVMQQLLGTGAEGATTQSVNGIMIPAQIEAMLSPTVVEVISMIFGNVTLILWKSGVQIIIFLAGLQSVSASVYESAKIDGATAWETYWKITMPMLAPITVLCIVYTVVNSFTDLSNEVISYIMNYSKVQTSYGPAAAMSWLYLLFVMIIMAAIFLFARRYTNGVYSD